MRTVLVTGSGGDIASELIRKLKHKKYEVIGLDIKAGHINPDIFISCDLASEEQISSSFSKYENKLLGVTDIVHLAGVYPNKRLDDYSMDLWNKVQAVNVASLFIIVKLLMAKESTLLKNIVCTSSSAAKVGSLDPAYASSKAALLGLCKSLSLALKEKSIRVNAVLPGIIDTAMSSAQTFERREYHRKKTLSQKIGTSEEVANVIEFLLSEESSYIWGSAIEVNGGMTF